MKLTSDAIKYMHASKNIPFLKEIIFDFTEISLPYGKEIYIN